MSKRAISSDKPERTARETWVGWSAVVTASLAVFAWSACCVLPLALSLAGLSLAGSGLIASQRTWITVAALLVVAGGWVVVLRKARRCEVDAACAAPSTASVWLLAAATALIVVSLLWTPLIEPVALRAVAGFAR